MGEQNCRKEEEMGDLSASKWNGFIRLKRRKRKRAEGEMTKDKICRKKNPTADIFPSNHRRRGKYDEGDGRTMTELHMATLQAELSWR